MLQFHNAFTDYVKFKKALIGDVRRKYAAHHDYRKFFGAVTEVSIRLTRGSTKKVSCPIKAQNGELLKEEEQVRNRWKEHYIHIFNQENNPNMEALNTIPQYNSLDVLDTSIPISEQEIKASIKQLKTTNQLAVTRFRRKSISV